MQPRMMGLRRPGGAENGAPHRRPARRRSRLTVTIQERPVLLGWRALEWFFARMPPRLAVAAMRGLYTLAYYAWPPKAEVIRSNMAHVMGWPRDDARTAAMARRSYRTYGRYLAELLRLPSRPLEEVSGLMDEHQLESFMSLHEGSHGMIVASAHLGNGEAMVAAFAHLGLPSNVLADDSSQLELFEYLNAQRSRWGVRMVPWRNLREVYRILRRGEILGITVDWGYRPGDVPVRLFGTWTTLPAGPATLAARTRALILPTFSYRQSNGRYFAFHTEPIRVADDAPATIQQATQRIAEALEEAVRRAPEQWYSFKRVWPRTAEEQLCLETRAAELLGAGARAGGA